MHLLPGEISDVDIVVDGPRDVFGRVGGIRMGFDELVEFAEGLRLKLLPVRFRLQVVRRIENFDIWILNPS